MTVRADLPLAHLTLQTPSLGSSATTSSSAMGTRRGCTTPISRQTKAAKSASPSTVTGPSRTTTRQRVSLPPFHLPSFSASVLNSFPLGIDGSCRHQGRPGQARRCDRMVCGPHLPRSLPPVDDRPTRRETAQVHRRRDQRRPRLVRLLRMVSLARPTFCASAPTRFCSLRFSKPIVTSFRRSPHAATRTRPTSSARTPRPTQTSSKAAPL